MEIKKTNVPSDYIDDEFFGKTYKLLAYDDPKERLSKLKNWTVETTVTSTATLLPIIKPLTEELLVKRPQVLLANFEPDELVTKYKQMSGMQLIYE
jgi:hypothetical protein